MKIRLRNPYGEKKSYTGSWNAKSKEWRRISADLLEKYDFKNQVNGQFFISLQDFIKYFGYISFVHMNLNAFHTKSSALNSNVKWINKEFKGAWVKGQNSGGKMLRTSFLFLFAVINYIK